MKKEVYLFKLSYSKHEKILRAYLNNKNEKVFTRREATKVMSKDGDIYPINGNTNLQTNY
jgi:hypothetical protein